ncbi:MAG TPA: hypothetical protein VGS79_06635 [Puia sp.]|nr:hypothetical protein [Puia sp.]
MLLNDLYSIEKWSASDTTAGEVRAVLVLNATHPIFAAHFPGQPVVPGACQLQMVEELLSHFLDAEFRLVNAGQLKFLTPIDPRRNPRIEAVTRYAAQTAESARPSSVPAEGMRPGPAPAELQVTATLSAAGATFLKLSGIFRAE